MWMVLWRMLQAREPSVYDRLQDVNGTKASNFGGSHQLVE
jgi:hypothetical protein